AADKDAFSEQLSLFGLEPWQPKKLHCVWPDNADASVRIDLTAISPRLGSTLREFSTAPLPPVPAAVPPAQRAYRLGPDKPDGAPAPRELMQGIALAPGGLARRLLPPAEELTPVVLRAVRQRANLWAIAEAPANALTSPERLLAQIGPALAE